MIVGACVPLLFAGLPLLAYERYGRSAIVAGALASGFSAGALLGAFGAYRVVSFASPTRVALIAAPWFALHLPRSRFTSLRGQLLSRWLCPAFRHRSSTRRCSPW
jgi:hypothetical protein